ncbi:MAG TPA: hypothetical protein VKZ60_19160 [Chloroflexota bacterium]|jgi:hypothetical protein|nr:hypothetical protein [Chloroflexota bacterium]
MSEPPLAASGWARRYDPVAAREARVLERVRATAGRECTLAEEVLAVYLDLLGAAEEDDRLAWPSEEARLACEACLVRLYDELLASYYLVQRGLYLQACRVWLTYLDTLVLALHMVHQPAAAAAWLRGEVIEPGAARRALEAAGRLAPLVGELQAQLDQQSHPRSKAGFERALTIRQHWGDWQLQFVLGGEGNEAWLRRGLADWLYLAAVGLGALAALGVVPADSGWSQRRAAVVGAVAAQLHVELP